MTIHDAVHALERAGIDVPHYRTDRDEGWIIGVEDGVAARRAALILTDVGCPPSVVRQQVDGTVDGGPWDIIVPVPPVTA